MITLTGVEVVRHNLVSALKLYLMLLVMVTCSDVVGNQHSELDLENIVVTGSRIQTSSDSVSGFVTVVTRQTIDERRDENLIDLLRSLPGVHISQAGGRGGIGSVQIRGGEANFTLVLIDGVKVNDSTNARGGSFDISTLPLSHIEKIEILRGAQSSIYGSDGLSGVISIQTRAFNNSEGTVSVAIGEQGFVQGAFAVGKGFNESSRLSFNLTTENDGDSLVGNQFKSHSASFVLDAALQDTVTASIRGSGLLSESSAFPDDSGGPKFSVVRALEHREQHQAILSGLIKYAPTERFGLNLAVGVNQHKEEGASPAIAPGIRNGVPASDFDSQLKRRNLTVNAIYDLTEFATATVGFDYLGESGMLVGDLEVFPEFSLPQDFDLNRHTASFFTEVQWTPTPNFSLQTSLRSDRADGYDAEITGRLGIEYDVRGIRYFVSWGDGFKLPSFYALGHALVGNRDLEPETSRSFDIGVVKTSNKSSAALSVFRNEYRNLINFDPASFRLVNEEAVITQGVEIFTSHRVNDAFVLGATATYIDT
ncbi:MAG: TonB-dependent receptor plug domain-containing protein, partial [Litorivicinaceae bacterium]